MYLLIDECCGKSLVGVAEALGHTAQRTKEVAALGAAATDAAIFEFARRNGAILVTINMSDYVDLAFYGGHHPGVILLPSVIGRQLSRLFRVVLPVAERLMQQDRNTFVQIDANRRVTSFRLP
jgi:predicted nuclease of predicted toxin-antitoxin system